MTSAPLLRLPEEMRQWPQWLLAGPNDAGELKVPTSIDAAGHLYPGSSTDNSTWLTFDEAYGAALAHGLGVGFVLSERDPFTCIDFDVKNVHNAPHNPEKWTSAEMLQRMGALVDWLDSYTELSQSGQGVHVWCYGSIGEGIKRLGVEVYSQERFIACTGKHIHTPAKPLNNRQDKLNELAANMRASANVKRSQLEEAVEELDDDEVMRRAWDADNATKFRRLWMGEWQDMGYPSQSEADLSLMSMLTFYSKSNEQCRRLFRRSALGSREKALKDDRYLDYTLRLIRGRQAKEEAAQEMFKEQSRQFVESLRAPDDSVRAEAAQYAQELQKGAVLPPSNPQAGPMPPAPPTPPTPEGGLPWPPGQVGELAKFIYGSANRPVKEVAIVAALGWFAGVCGKAWNIPGSGLNLYIVLVARSGVGKETMHSGLGAFTHRLRMGVPGVDKFVDFGDMASGPALGKVCADKTSFVHVTSEWGRKLQLLAHDSKSGPMQTLRTLMTALYQKSGPASIVGGINYSNKDSNVASVSGVSYSMIGETTPETFYASLTESMMEDGFLSRFCIVEYDGPRPPANKYINLEPSNELTQYGQELCAASMNMIASLKRVQVSRTAEAGKLMDAFDLECDANINASSDESWRQMWNRAHLKMCRVAALLAVGVNYHAPVIAEEHVAWALDVVRRDIAIMKKRIESGDVGQGDTARERKLLSIIHEFVTKPLPESYGIPQQMARDGVVPRKYLQMRASSVAAFRSHPYGAKRALDDAIQSCCDSGWLAEIPKEKAGEAYTFQGRCFRVVQLPRFS